MKIQAGDLSFNVLDTAPKGLVWHGSFAFQISVPLTNCGKVQGKSILLFARLQNYELPNQEPGHPNAPTSVGRQYTSHFCGNRNSLGRRNSIGASWRRARTIWPGPQSSAAENGQGGSQKLSTNGLQDRVPKSVGRALSAESRRPSLEPDRRCSARRWLHFAGSANSNSIPVDVSHPV